MNIGRKRESMRLAHGYAACLERELIMLGYPHKDIAKSVSVWIDLLKLEYEETLDKFYESTK